MKEEDLLELFEKILETKNSDGLFEAVAIANSLKKKIVVPYLCDLLQETWHYTHEDIAKTLQQIPDPRAVDALFKTATKKFTYLSYDNSYALARKCTWALADIGTIAAKEALIKLAANADKKIAGYAQKRVDRWEEETERKNLFHNNDSVIKPSKSQQMIKKFLKNNGFFLAMLATMTILIIFVIPYLEKSYLVGEIALIRKKAMWVLLWVIVVLFGILAMILLKIQKGSKAILKSLISTIVVLASLSFALHPFILSGMLFLNKLYTKEIIEKKCTVIYANENFLRVKVDSTTFDIETEKFSPANKMKLKANSAVTVTQKKGLLGFYFAPSVVPAQK